MQRADLLMLSRGLAASRAQAQRLIAAGQVCWQTANGQWQRVGKAGLSLHPDTALRIDDDSEKRYVSRGGLKLAGALQHSGICVTGTICLDVGQSTGGFTDCLLQAGAARVIGVDVGHSQLHERLRHDTRVQCLEKINARALPISLRDATPQAAGFDLAVMDVSFISQTLVLPALAPLLREYGALLSLVKPQFEAGSQYLNKRGVINSEEAFALTREKLFASAAACNLTVLDYFDSSITGGDGNREFFIYARKNVGSSPDGSQ